MGLRSPAIHMLLKETNHFPLERYMDSREFSPELRRKAGIDSLQDWQKGWVDAIGGVAPVDDDTNYTVLSLKLIQHYGRNFRPNDVLEAWLSWLPMFATCTAERVAYRNAASGLTAPMTAQKMHPYREWIGAQIRGDFFGCINPGRPRKAAHMAWHDASVSHVKNGIYGKMFAAAMIAKAAVFQGLQSVVGCGHKEIPATSRLAESVRRVLSWHASGISWKDVVQWIHLQYDEWNPHDWCHTNSNAMIVTAALLYGRGNFGHSICMAEQSAFDTDCNGATVGSILGMMIVATSISECWTKPIGGSVYGSPVVTVEELAQETMDCIPL